MTRKPTPTGQDENLVAGGRRASVCLDSLLTLTTGAAGHGSRSLHSRLSELQGVNDAVPKFQTKLSNISCMLRCVAMTHGCCVAQRSLAALLARAAHACAFRSRSRSRSLQWAALPLVQVDLAISVGPSVASAGHAACRARAKANARTQQLAASGPPSPAAFLALFVSRTSRATRTHTFGRMVRARARQGKQKAPWLRPNRRREFKLHTLAGWKWLSHLTLSPRHLFSSFKRFNLGTLLSLASR